MACHMTRIATSRARRRCDLRQDGVLWGLPEWIDFRILTGVHESAYGLPVRCVGAGWGRAMGCGVDNAGLKVLAMLVTYRPPAEATV